MKFSFFPLFLLLAFTANAQVPDAEFFQSESEAFLNGSIRKELDETHLANAKQILAKRNIIALEIHWDDEELQSKELIVITEAYNAKTGNYSIAEAYAMADDETYQRAYWSDETEPGLEDISFEVAETPTSISSEERLVTTEIPDIIMNVSMEGVPEMSKKECRQMYMDEYKNAYTLITYYNVKTKKCLHVLEYPPKKVKFKVKNITWEEMMGG